MKTDNYNADERQLSNTIADLQGLKDGWDGRRSKAVTEKAAKSMRAVIQGFDKAQVVPMNDGGLQLEWGGTEIEIHPNGSIEILIDGSECLIDR